jgi:hypothetical protein
MAAQVLAQSGTAPTPQFEVTSIKPANPEDSNKHRPMVTDPRLLSVPAFTLRDLVLKAYAVKRYQLTGGPGWIASEQFDVEAKPTNPASREQLMLMLRSLLADRFKLALHTETRELAVYALEVAKDGPKFRVDPTRGNLWFADLPALVDYLNLFNSRPVIDKTGHTWNSHFVLNTGEINVTAADAAGGPPSMTDTFQATVNALESQLGLKLVPTKVPIQVMVIDHAERPSEN